MEGYDTKVTSSAVTSIGQLVQKLKLGGRGSSETNGMVV